MTAGQVILDAIESENLRIGITATNLTSFR